MFRLSDHCPRVLERTEHLFPQDRSPIEAQGCTHVNTRRRSVDHCPLASLQRQDGEAICRVFRLPRGAGEFFVTPC